MTPETAIYLLCTGVLYPTKYEKNKLKQLLQLLNFTIKSDCIIGDDNIQNLEVWLYASYALHDDMTCPTDGCMYMVWGMVHWSASKKCKH